MDAPQVGVCIVIGQLELVVHSIGVVQYHAIIHRRLGHGANLVLTGHRSAHLVALSAHGRITCGHYLE